jgi:2-keto-3-deoxy-L-rhamnonate aldolase RhmA
MELPVVAVYDANILYPAPLRDLVIRLAQTELVRAKWTETIHDEWTCSVLEDNPKLSAERLARNSLPSTRRSGEKPPGDASPTSIERSLPAMRENPVKRKLLRGECSYGTMMLEFATTGIARLAAGASAEFAVFDMEHTGWSTETLRMLLATSRAADIVPIVRPPVAEYSFIARLLDLGAMGILAPMVHSAEDARRIVACAKYPPQGRRGAAFSVSHDDYSGGDVVAKMRSSNDEVLVIALIESVAGLESVEEIAAVDGIDALWIGQFDLTASMGIPGETRHPEFVRAFHRVREAATAAGKAAAYGTLELDDLCAARDAGYRLLIYTADLWIYQRGLRAGLERVRALPPRGT